MSVFITLSLVSSFQSSLFPLDVNLITKEDGHTVPFLLVPVAGTHSAGFTKV